MGKPKRLAVPKLCTRNRARALAVLSTMLVCFWSVDAAPTRPLRIMPLGDSLTSSIDGQLSYRYWLWTGLQRGRYFVDFVGTQWGVGSGAGAPQDFDEDHEGHPGATSDEILAGISGWGWQTRPQVVLMIVGATDFEHGYTPGHALMNCSRIINRLRKINPYVQIYWAMLPPDPDTNVQVRAYNSGVLRLAPAQSTPWSPIRVVNLYSSYIPSRDTVDGVHPNSTGEKIFASRFFYAISPWIYAYKR